MNLEGFEVQVVECTGIGRNVVDSGRGLKGMVRRVKTYYKGESRRNGLSVLYVEGYGERKVRIIESEKNWRR